MDEGVEQTARYVDRCAAEAGHLVVIDQRENRSWERRSTALSDTRCTSGAAVVPCR